MVRAKDCPEAYEWSEISTAEGCQAYASSNGYTFGVPTLVLKDVWSIGTRTYYKESVSANRYKVSYIWAIDCGSVWMATNSKDSCSVGYEQIAKTSSDAEYGVDSDRTFSSSEDPSGCFLHEGHVYFNVATTSHSCATDMVCIHNQKDDYKTYMLGSIQYDVGADTCGTCFPGHYSTDHGCLPCPTGRYSSKLQISSQGFLQSCTTCEQGRFQDETGQADRKACAQNTYQNDRGETSCKDIGENFIAAGTGAWIGRS